jgi:sister-chromatid-cohesion protein PDS5
VKKEKVAKEAKTPKQPKKQKQVLSPPAPSSAAARRSSRGTSARKSYADRDSDEDEQEMMGGVAKWKYIDEDSDEQSGDEEDVEEVDEKLSTPQPVEESEPEAEPEPMDEDTPEVEEEVKPTPPRSNGRKAKAPVASSKKNTPVVKAVTRGTKQTAESPLVSKPKSPAMPKIRAKAPLVSRSKGKDAKSKGKGKGKASDIYDFDDSE